MKQYFQYGFFIALLLMSLITAGCGSNQKDDMGLRSPCLNGY